MGNIFSGRWRNYRKKSVVEDAYVLDISDIRHETHRNVLKPGVYWSGAVSAWTASETLPLLFEIDTRDMHAPWLRLLYYTPDTRTPVMERIALQTTTLYAGGHRFWLTCPCGRRQRKLYRAPSGGNFRCRTCAGGLSYRSCQQSHSRYAGC